MNIWGKIVGGFFGFLLAGAPGILLGVFAGHFFDRGLQQNFQTISGARAQAQEAFFNTTFLVMGHLAKADGQVSQAEIQAAREAMRRMALDESMREKAMLLFNQGKQPTFNLDQTLTEFIQACRYDRVLLRLFVDIQLQTTQLEQNPSLIKQQILQKICSRLGYTGFNFAMFEHLFRAGYQQQQQYNYQQRTHGAHTRNQISLQEAYKTLGIAETAQPAEIKRAYRRLMSQHHPDKLLSKGLPEAMIKLATEKTQKIKAAYDQIAKARGM